MSTQKKHLIISLAQQAEDKRKSDNLSSEATVNWFVDQVKQNNISLNGWFSLDDEVRKVHEIASWFWIIRTVRNNVSKYA